MLLVVPRLPLRSLALPFMADDFLESNVGEGIPWALIEAKKE